MRERAGQGVFDSGKTHHFTAYLGEAFQAAEDRHVTFGVHTRDIAGVIPAVERFELRVCLLVQISLHHVGTTHEQTAAFGDAFDGFEFVFNVR